MTKTFYLFFTAWLLFVVACTSTVTPLVKTSIDRTIKTSTVGGQQTCALEPTDKVVFPWKCPNPQHPTPVWQVYKVETKSGKILSIVYSCIDNEPLQIRW